MNRLMLITALSLGLATTAIAQDLLPKSIGPSVLPTPAINTRAGVTAPCEALLPQMQAARTAVRHKRPLTPEQERQWSTWNALCKHDPWPQRLTALDDPAEVARYYDRTPKIPKEHTPGYYWTGNAPVLPSDYGTPGPSYSAPSYSGPPRSSYTSCITLANRSVSCYTTGGW
jgi:hypothetical protein